MNQNVVAASVEDDAVEVDAQYHPLLDNNYISWTTRRYIDISPKKHQGGKKVVLKVYLQDIQFAEQAHRDRFIALTGPRFNKNKGTLMLVGDSYPTLRQNKKALVDLLCAIIEESQK